MKKVRSVVCLGKNRQYLKDTNLTQEGHHTELQPCQESQLIKKNEKKISSDILGVNWKSGLPLLVRSSLFVCFFWFEL